MPLERCRFMALRRAAYTLRYYRYFRASGAALRPLRPLMLPCCQRYATGLPRHVRH